MELGDAELCLKPEELRARGTDLAEMAQVSNFILRRREEGRQKEKKRRKKWLKIPFCASLTWQTGAWVTTIYIITIIQGI